MSDLEADPVDQVVPPGASGVLRWRKQRGDRVIAGQPLFEVGAVVVAATNTGVLWERMVADGSAVRVGEVVGQVLGDPDPLVEDGTLGERSPVPVVARPGGMRSHTDELWFELPERVGFVNITVQVEAAVEASGVKEGLCLVNAMHITASVFVNDDEPGLHEDFRRWLERIAPYDRDGYAHHRTGEDNGDAHLRRQIMGREVVVAITRGRLHFGPWEQIFYGEFDGRRRKRVLVKIIGA